MKEKSNGFCSHSSDYTPHSVLVTGAAGFIGSHVALGLLKSFSDIKVYSFDCLQYCSSLRNLDPANEFRNHEFIKGDICSIDFVLFILRTKQIDTIVHSAAQTHVDNSFGNSLEFTRVNTYGTHVLLEASKRYGGVKRFLHVSTDEVYGENNDNGIHCEAGSMLQPTNPYASSKAAAELICQAYVKSFNLPVIVTRGNNVYGERQFPEKLIPKFSFQWQKGQKLTVHGNGGTRRNYIYISDVVEAMLLIIRKGVVGQIYNIGGDERDELSVLDITKHIVRYFLAKESGLNKKTITEEQVLMAFEDHVIFTSDRHYNDKRYNISVKRLRQLGWNPKVSFDVGLETTLNWYRNRDNWNHWGDKAVDLAIVAHPRFLGDECCNEP